MEQHDVLILDQKHNPWDREYLNRDLTIAQDKQDLQRHCIGFRGTGSSSGGGSYSLKTPTYNATTTGLRSLFTISFTTNILSAPVDALHGPTINSIQSRNHNSPIVSLVACELLESIVSSSNPGAIRLLIGIGIDVDIEGYTARESAF